MKNEDQQSTLSGFHFYIIGLKQSNFTKTTGFCKHYLTNESEQCSITGCKS